MTGKVWTKKNAMGEENTVNTVSTETHHIKGDKINLISTNNCRILSFKLIVPN